MAPDYDHLTLLQKVEVFEHAMEHTQGDDLAKVLWLKSPSSEVKLYNLNCLDLVKDIDTNITTSYIYKNRFGLIVERIIHVH